MKLETERLIISKSIIGEAEFFFRLQTQKKWIQFIGDRGINSVSDAKKKLDSNIKKCSNLLGWELFTFRVKETNEPIGATTFVQRDYLDFPDIGFAMLTEYEGDGYAFEATKSTLGYGKSELGFSKLYGIVSPENVQSISLMRKLDFKEIQRISPNSEELILFSNY